MIGNTVGAAGGAFLGHTLGKGDPLFTTIGAGSGALLSEALQAGSSAAAQKSHDAGYEKGRAMLPSSNTKLSPSGNESHLSQYDVPDVRLLDVPLPEREENGVILAPTTAILRIQE